MEVVDEIASTPTSTAGPHADVPVTPVVIKKVTLKP
jgi:peptidyl-prolyl cis-trans isomerase A (cyclophilin A)